MNADTFAQSLPILKEFLALEVVGDSNGAKIVQHPNTGWQIIAHENGADAPIKSMRNHYGVRVTTNAQGKTARCCAGGSWTHCDRFAKEIQVDRLREARATGAEVLVTACPKCRIHFRCAMRDEDARVETEIEMKDLAEVVAGALA